MKYIFHHDDADGRLSGFIAGYADRIESIYVECSYAKQDEIKEYITKNIRPNDSVYILDFSFDIETMYSLYESVRYLTWIDHHITSIEAEKESGYFGHKYKIPGYRVNGVSASMLTYWYFNTPMGKIGMEGLPDDVRDFSVSQKVLLEDAPSYIVYVNDYDVWNNIYPNTRYFISGLSAEETRPNVGENIWYKLHTEVEATWEVIKKGEAVEAYKKNFSIAYPGFELELEGYKCYASNVGRLNSNHFDKVWGEHEIYILFYYDGKMWNVSLYSDQVNVSDIAKKYGGGGHKGAAGFTSTELPFYIL